MFERIPKAIIANLNDFVTTKETNLTYQTNQSVKNEKRPLNCTIAQETSSLKKSISSLWKKEKLF